MPASAEISPKYSTIEFLFFSFIHIYPGVFQEMVMKFSNVDIANTNHCCVYIYNISHSVSIGLKNALFKCSSSLNSFINDIFHHNFFLSLYT